MSVYATWLLLAGIVVMFMHIGFAMIATGFCRAKNALDTMTMNLLLFPLSCLAFWIYGFALGWGNFTNGAVAPGWSANLELPSTILNRGLGIIALRDEAGKPSGGYAYGLAGSKGFFLAGLDPSVAGVPPANGNASVSPESSSGDRRTTGPEGHGTMGALAFFFFMMALIDKAAPDPRRGHGRALAVEEFLSLRAVGCIAAGVGCQLDLGRRLAGPRRAELAAGARCRRFRRSGRDPQSGRRDRPGRRGVAGAAPGKYRGGRPQPLPGHHVPMVVLGSLVVAFGWFAWNAGCALAGTDLSLSGVVVNTTFAAVGGTLAAMLTLEAKKMKPDPTLICNGMIAGLVAVSGPCPFVDTWAAVLIGAVAGSVVVVSVLLLERRGIDDPVGAISVHGVAGLWGLLAVGIFANGKYGAGFNGVAERRPRPALWRRWASSPPR